jgi:hypothetical protein
VIRQAPRRAVGRLVRIPRANPRDPERITFNIWLVFNYRNQLPPACRGSCKVPADPVRILDTAGTGRGPGREKLPAYSRPPQLRSGSLERFGRSVLYRHEAVHPGTSTRSGHVSTAFSGVRDVAIEFLMAFVTCKHQHPARFVALPCHEDLVDQCRGQLLR